MNKYIVKWTKEFVSGTLDGITYDTAKRNRLIEEYMEKTGCYPGVFSSDRHGNVFAVNTKENQNA